MEAVYHYLDGTAGAADLDLLRAAVRDDPAMVRFIFEAAQQRMLLNEHFAAPGGSRPVSTAIMNELAAALGGSQPSGDVADDEPEESEKGMTGPLAAVGGQASDLPSARLVVREGTGVGTAYKIAGPRRRFVLGRRRQNDVLIQDKLASRDHAEITRDGDLFAIRDLESRNGTLLNGNPTMGRERLQPGDKIRVGDTVLEFIEDAEAGLRVPGYEIIERIGRGHMGTVYKARQVSMDRVVALRVLSSRYGRNSDFVQRFIRDARLSAKLNHPNVIRVLDADRAGDVYYVSTEHFDAKSVRQMLLEDGQIEVDRALEIVRQAAGALQYAHEKGITHRDIKPESLVVTVEGVTKVTELGLARYYDEPPAGGEGSRLPGSPHYMAPEQAAGGKIDARTDVYCLGATLYHMLTGVAPFQGDDSEDADPTGAHTSGTLAPIQEEEPDVPDSVAHIVERMMARSPEKRYQSMAELIGDLGKVTVDREASIKPLDAGQSVIVPATSESRQVGVQRKRRRVARRAAVRTGRRSGGYAELVAALIIIAAMGIGGLMLLGGGGIGVSTDRQPAGPSAARGNVPPRGAVDDGVRLASSAPVAARDTGGPPAAAPGAAAKPVVAGWLDDQARAPARRGDQDVPVARGGQEDKDLPPVGPGLDIIEVLTRERNAPAPAEPTEAPAVHEPAPPAAGGPGSAPAEEKDDNSGVVVEFFAKRRDDFVSASEKEYGTGGTGGDVGALRRPAPVSVSTDVARALNCCRPGTWEKCSLALKSGEQLSGELIDSGDTLRFRAGAENSRERRIARADVVRLEFERPKIVQATMAEFYMKQGRLDKAAEALEGAKATAGNEPYVRWQAENVKTAVAVRDRVEKAVASRSTREVLVQMTTFIELTRPDKIKPEWSAALADAWAVEAARSSESDLQRWSAAGEKVGVKLSRPAKGLE